MEGFVASTDPSRINNLQVGENWEAAAAADPQLHGSEEAQQLLSPLLAHFSGSMKATLSHLTTVHNETCGCQTGSSTHETINRVWNQKKVLFMELQKQCGLEEFEDFLNRVLRLLLTNSIRDIPPLSESEFWMMLRTSYQPEVAKAPCTAMDSMEEDLADINNLIAKDIGGEPNQVFMTQSPPPQSDFLGSSDVISPSPSMGLSSPPPASTSSSSSFTMQLYNMDELLHMKRKEKHMAPIDCSGVSAAFNVTWKCKNCDRQHGSKDDCEFYRNYHHPRHFVYNNPTNLLDLPNELELRHDGVYTSKNGLKPYTRLGPLKGQVSVQLFFIMVQIGKKMIFAFRHARRATWTLTRTGPTFGSFTTKMERENVS